MNKRILYSVFAISAVFFVVIFLLMFFKPQLFHWTYFLSVAYFAALTYFMLDILLKKVGDSMFVSTFSMLSGAKLLFSLMFIFIVIILLPKAFMKSFLAFSALGYLSFTFYEISVLLKVLKQENN